MHYRFFNKEHNPAAVTDEMASSFRALEQVLQFDKFIAQYGSSLPRLQSWTLQNSTVSPKKFDASLQYRIGDSDSDDNSIQFSINLDLTNKHEEVIVACYAENRVDDLTGIIFFQNLPITPTASFFSTTSFLYMLRFGWCRYSMPTFLISSSVIFANHLLNNTAIFNSIMDSLSIKLEQIDNYLTQHDIAAAEILLSEFSLTEKLMLERVILLKWKYNYLMAQLNDLNEMHESAERYYFNAYKLAEAPEQKCLTLQKLINLYFKRQERTEISFENKIVAAIQLMPLTARFHDETIKSTQDQIHIILKQLQERNYSAAAKLFGELKWDAFRERLYPNLTIPYYYLKAFLTLSGQLHPEVDNLDVESRLAMSSQNLQYAKNVYLKYFTPSISSSITISLEEARPH
jgi:hypothetical protein